MVLWTALWRSKGIGKNAIKKIVTSILVALLFASNAYAVPGVNEFCNNQYSIGDEKAPVCTNQSLTEREIKILERHAYRVLFLYPEFIKKYGYTFDKPSQKVVIFVITYNQMNDPKLFPKDKNLLLENPKKALARYFPFKDKMYITRKSLTGSNTDFVHEMAHYLNECVGVIKLNGLDEKIATAFEKHYRKHYGLE